MYKTKNFFQHQYSFVLAITVLFLVVHFPPDKIELLLNLFKPTSTTSPAVLPQLIIFFRGLLFTVALIWPFYYAYHPLKQFFKTHIAQEGWRNSLKQAVLTTLSTAILIIPIGLWSMGYEYGRISLSPFAETSGYYHSRLLMPALGYLLFLRGQFFYFVFTLLLTLLLVFLVIIWFKANKVYLGLWQLISLASSSFIIYQFQAPGYPDVLLFGLLILLVLMPPHTLGQLSLVALCLITHEASIIILAAITLFYFNTKLKIKALLIYGLYFTIWLSSYGFNLTQALNSRNVEAQSGWTWVINNQFLAIFGVIFAYKLLWLIIIGAIYLLLRQKNYKMALQIITFLSGGLLMIFLAVDTSRLFGFSFLALLLATEVVYKAQKYKPRIKPLLLALYLSNLLIPSFYIGLNQYFALPAGLYQKIWLLWQST